MTIPNLDAMWHCWVELLPRFTFSIEYQNGRNNTATDALSHVISKLDTVTMKYILDGVTMGMTKRANGSITQVVADADKEIQKPSPANCNYGYGHCPSACRPTCD